MAPKHHPTLLSGGDRKAFRKELAKSPFIEQALAEKAADLRGRGEALLRESDDLACQAWNERMWRAGEPIDPSPTIDQAINGGYPYLQVQCSRCRAPRDVDLTIVRHVATTCVHDLATRLSCDKCKRGGHKPAATLEQLTRQPRGTTGL